MLMLRLLAPSRPFSTPLPNSTSRFVRELYVLLVLNFFDGSVDNGCVYMCLIDIYSTHYILLGPCGMILRKASLYPKLPLLFV